ncbi:hypothetical protein [Paracidovorax avenae]|uniref:hypothetical protein n=1 Tax=Paracidovorax avenae TaxID=80867 RepID=UPI00186559B4|nr:hypothetical protein [Paracidovorax avenae]
MAYNFTELNEFPVYGVILKMVLVFIFCLSLLANYFAWKYLAQPWDFFAMVISVVVAWSTFRKLVRPSRAVKMNGDEPR